MDIDVIYNENCIEVLKRLEDNTIDAIVTDAPYNLGFMGKKWDKTGIAFNLELWKECLRVIKPGGNLLSFGGTRTYHRMVCAIEDAGFEIRDCIIWVYGSGFPKSLNISKAIDKVNGEVGRLLRFVEWMRRTGLKSVQINNAIGKSDIGSHYLRRDQPAIPTRELWMKLRPLCGDVPVWVDELVERIEAEREVIGKHPHPAGNKGNTFPLNQECNLTLSATSEAKLWEGYGTGLKPAYEPICLAMKPLDGTFAENCLKWGVGGLNIDGCRIGTADDVPNRSTGLCGASKTFGQVKIAVISEPWVATQGRFPANFIHDGSQEVMELFPLTQSHPAGRGEQYRGGIFGGGKATSENCYGDNGSAARFFYTAKASKRERGEGNTHCTVKPLALMEYLVKLVTRPGHVVLDPFIGSGTTAMACVKLGRHYIGCELDKGYYDIAIKRIIDI